MSTNRYELASQENDGIRNAARLLYISSAKYGGDWHSTLHTHTCSELFYVTHGVGQFRIADQIYPVSANDLIIVNANVPHTEISLGDSPLAYIALGVEGLELSVSEEEEDVTVSSILKMYVMIFCSICKICSKKLKTNLRAMNLSVKTSWTS